MKGESINVYMLWASGLDLISFMRLRYLRGYEEEHL